MKGKRNPDETARTSQPDVEKDSVSHGHDDQVANRGKITDHSSEERVPDEDDERFDAG